jgi:hypothetical protein
VSTLRTDSDLEREWLCNELDAMMVQVQRVDFRVALRYTRSRQGSESNDLS